MISEYLSDIVLPTVQEYLDDVQNRRKCFLACAATYHVVDRIAADKSYGFRKPQNASTYLKSKCSSFPLIEDVAVCFKHIRRGDGAWVKLTDNLVISRPAASWDEGEWDLSRWGDELGGIEALGATASVDVTKALYETVQFLCAEYEPTLKLGIKQSPGL